MSDEVEPTGSNSDSINSDSVEYDSVESETRRLQKQTRFSFHTVLSTVLAILLLAVLLVMITGLDDKLNSNPDNTSTAESFTGRWQLEEQFLELESDGQVVGYDGCNSLRAAWTQLGENEVSFSPFSSTRRACPDSEGKQLLGEAANASLDSKESTLYVYSQKGEVLAVLAGVPAE